MSELRNNTADVDPDILLKILSNYKNLDEALEMLKHEEWFTKEMEKEIQRRLGIVPEEDEEEEREREKERERESSKRKGTKKETSSSPSRSSSSKKQQQNHNTGEDGRPAPLDPSSSSSLSPATTTSDGPASAPCSPSSSSSLPSSSKKHNGDTNHSTSTATLPRKPSQLRPPHVNTRGRKSATTSPRHKSPSSASSSTSPKAWGTPLVDDALSKKHAMQRYSEITKLLKSDPTNGTSPLSPRSQFQMDFDAESLQLIEKSRAEQKRLAEIHRKNMERRERLEMIEARRQEKLRAQLEEEERARQAMIEEYENMRKERVEERQRMRLARQEEKEREKEMAKQARERVASHLHETPLHVKLQRKYEREVLAEEQREYEETLQKIRKERGPLNVDELKEHERKFMKEYKRVMAEKKREAKNKSNHREHTIPSLYKGSAYKNCLDEEASRIEEQNKKDVELRAMIQKRERYANLVQEMYAPKTDKTKEWELHSRIEKLHEMKERAKKTKNPRKINYLNEVAEKRRNGQIKPIVRSFIQEEEEKKIQKPIDYLTKMRLEKEAHPDKHPRRRHKMSKEERVEKLQREANRLERDAVKRESRMARRESDVDAAAEVSDMYIEAIRTKLKLLQEV